MFNIWTASLLAGLLIASVYAGCPDKSEYPKVTLGWGSYLPTDCDSTLDIYIFRNIRFGKAPDGSSGGTRRFAQSQPPADISNPQDVIIEPPTGPTACLAVPVPNNNGDKEHNTPDYGSPIQAPGDSSTDTSEDCLFLDVYVPISAIPTSAESETVATPLPVVVWIYGGAYLFGSKDGGLANKLPFYDGHGLIQGAQALGSNLIFVTGNYRLAHLGWLAGPIVNDMTDPDQAVTNAGFTDQRLLLEFVQSYIGHFGGDPGQVTAFGESAGASSILHHLVAKNDDGSPRDPLFKQAVMQSPAYQWIWDQTPSGVSQVIFDNFTVNVQPCSAYQGVEALSCVQNNATSDQIQAAMTAYGNIAYSTGIFNLGPVVDGTTFPSLPVQLLESGKFQFHPRVTAIIASHVADEAASFVPKYATSDSGFQLLLDYFLPGTSTVRTSQKKCITTRYSNYEIEDQANQVIQDSMFVCNVRFTYDAVEAASAAASTSSSTKAVGKSPSIWLMDYAFFAKAILGYDLAQHGTDLMPTFWNDATTQDPSGVVQFICDHVKQILPAACRMYLNNIYFPAMVNMRPTYQAYMASFITSGNPNPSSGKLPVWPAPSGDGNNVLQITNLMPNFVQTESPDQLILEDTCQFWKTMADSATSGTAPDEKICVPKPNLGVDKAEDSTARAELQALKTIQF
ncbi:Alpha/Beta hydrolase protein [Rhypophila decipiens]|uniref:Alpha/Beta hydrolase protein n=1 Tax=Rhypophila decipiens TaxID=261697 RepID=A0AAN6Y396_9PEZI|nr:Alpha/Beta hydrolase protein [Rhypophila decipiens]